MGGIRLGFQLPVSSCFHGLVSVLNRVAMAAHSRGRKPTAMGCHRYAIPNQDHRFAIQQYETRGASARTPKIGKLFRDSS